VNALAPETRELRHLPFTNSPPFVNTPRLTYQGLTADRWGFAKQLAILSQKLGAIFSEQCIDPIPVNDCIQCRPRSRPMTEYAELSRNCANKNSSHHPRQIDLKKQSQDGDGCTDDDGK
jgi:hypothetical protein